MPKIFFKDPVHKQFKKINKVERKKIFKKIQSLASDPYAGKALQSEYKGLYSLRAWPYRIIYKIKKSKLVIYSVSHRQTSYKK